MKSQTAKRTISALIIIVLCFTLFSFSTTAVSLDTKGSITLYTLDKESKEPISGAVFRIYLFATSYTNGDNIYYVLISLNELEYPEYYIVESKLVAKSVAEGCIRDINAAREEKENQLGTKWNLPPAAVIKL